MCSQRETQIKDFEKRTEKDRKQKMYTQKDGGYWDHD